MQRRFQMEHSSVHIRRALLTDSDALYEMLCALEGTRLDLSLFNKVFEENSVNPRIAYFIAEVDAGPVGMASCHVQLLLHHVGPVAEIQEMYVQEAYRSLKIGRRLMQEVALFAQEHGAMQIEVTSRDHRIDAHRFYEREGFEKSHVKLVRYLT